MTNEQSNSAIPREFEELKQTIELLPEQISTAALAGDMALAGRLHARLTDLQARLEREPNNNPDLIAAQLAAQKVEWQALQDRKEALEKETAALHFVRKEASEKLTAVNQEWQAVVGKVSRVERDIQAMAARLQALGQH